MARWLDDTIAESPESRITHCSHANLLAARCPDDADLAWEFEGFVALTHGVVEAFDPRSAGAALAFDVNQRRGEGLDFGHALLRGPGALRVRLGGFDAAER